MFTTCQRYLFISFIPPFIISMVFWVSFLIIFQLFSIIGIVINKGIDIGVFFSLLGNISLSFFPIAVPLSVFLATFYVLNKFSEDSEIIAMRSFGMTKFDLFKPYLIAGLVVSIAMLGLVQEIIPSGNRGYRNAVYYLSSKGMMNEIKQGEFFTDVPGVILFANEVKDKGEVLGDVFIQRIDDTTGDEILIYAKSGRVVKNLPESGEGLPEVRLRLYDGNVLNSENQQNADELVFFKSMDIPVFSGGIYLKKSRSYTTYSSKELWQLISQKDYIEKQMNEYKSHHPNASEGELRGELKSLTKKYYRAGVEYWTRVGTPLQTFVFCFIAFTLGIKKGRGDAGHAGITSFGMILIYYVTYFSLLAMSKKGLVPSVLVPMVPFLILTGFGIHFYRKLNWNS